MIAWSIELSEFNIEYQTRGAIKARVLVNFITDLTGKANNPTKEVTWTLYIDGSSNQQGNIATVILENDEGDSLE